MNLSRPLHQDPQVSELSGLRTPPSLTAEAITRLFYEGIQKAKADEHVSHREVRELGRELGVSLSKALSDPPEQSTLRHLIATCAELINNSDLLPEHQASCWSNLRKGFIGDTESFELGQARSAIIDAVEMELPRLHSMFYRYPNPTNPDALVNFQRLRDAIEERFPTLSQQSAHESALIMYGLGQSRREPQHQTQERYSRLANRILAVCEKHIRENQNLSLVSVLRPLSRIASIYDRASHRINEGQRAQVSINDRPHRVATRFDLLERVSRPEQLAALISPAVQTAASSLISRGSYIGRLYLDTIVDFPRYHATLHRSCPQTRHLLETRYSSLVHEPAGDPSTRVASIGAKGLREFTTTSYINIGLECLNQSPHDPRFHADSSRDVAMLSEFIFEKVAALEFERLRDAHGPPSSRYGFLGGGANARREYPSFDYDWFLVYEREGQTMPVPGQPPISNRDFFAKLSRAVNTSLSYLGANSDGAFFPHHPISLKPESAVTKDRYDQLLAGSPDPHMELRLRVNMIPLGGDYAFCTEWLTHVSTLTRSASAEIMQNQTRVILDTARAELPPDNINIKTSPGGLRLGTHLWILCSTAYDRSFDSFEDLTSFLRGEDLIGKEDATCLTKAYHYLLRLRVRMDMQYGRNDKQLPTGEELGALAKSLGLGPTRNGIPAESVLKSETLLAMRELRAIIGGSHARDGSIERPGVVHSLRERILTMRGVDIFENSGVTIAEQRSKQARLDYISSQAARAENLWFRAMSEPSLE
jgi:hypothetical protein